MSAAATVRRPRRQCLRPRRPTLCPPSSRSHGAGSSREQARRQGSRAPQRVNRLRATTTSHALLRREHDPRREMPNSGSASHGVTVSPRIHDRASTPAPPPDSKVVMSLTTYPQTCQAAWTRRSGQTPAGGPRAMRVAARCPAAVTRIAHVRRQPGSAGDCRSNTTPDTSTIAAPARDAVSPTRRAASDSPRGRPRRHFNAQVIPDPVQQLSSEDGGVLWADVAAGVYTVRAHSPVTSFASFVATCRPGRIVNANPPWGLHELGLRNPARVTADWTVRARRLHAALASARERAAHRRDGRPSAARAAAARFVPRRSSRTSWEAACGRGRPSRSP